MCYNVCKHQTNKYQGSNYQSIISSKVAVANLAWHPNTTYIQAVVISNPAVKR